VNLARGSITKMNKEVFEITNKITQSLMETKGCKISEVSVIPDGDDTFSIKTRVTIKFSYYETDNDGQSKERIRTGSKW
jgi:hypothetical protein